MLQVLSNVDKLQELCSFSSHTPSEQTATAANAPHVYRCAGLLKILMDAPEQEGFLARQNRARGWGRTGMRVDAR